MRRSQECDYATTSDEITSRGTAREAFLYPSQPKTESQDQVLGYLAEEICVLDQHKSDDFTQIRGVQDLDVAAVLGEDHMVQVAAVS